MEAYCMKCKGKQTMSNPQEITMKNGRPATQGVCPVCGTKMFKIGKPNFLTVPKVQNFGKKKNMYLGKLKKLQSQYALSDKDSLGMYHESYWREYVYNASKQFKVKLKPVQFAKLVKRWAYFDKSYKIPQIKKDFGKNQKFLDWILKTDKFDHNKIFKQNIKPFEVLFFQVGAEILKNITSFRLERSF